MLTVLKVFFSLILTLASADDIKIKQISFLPALSKIKGFKSDTKTPLFEHFSINNRGDLVAVSLNESVTEIDSGLSKTVIVLQLKDSEFKTVALFNLDQNKEDGYIGELKFLHGSVLRVERLYLQGEQDFVRQYEFYDTETQSQFKLNALFPEKIIVEARALSENLYLVHVFDKNSKAFKYEVVNANIELESVSTRAKLSNERGKALMSIADESIYSNEHGDVLAEFQINQDGKAVKRVFTFTDKGGFTILPEIYPVDPITGANVSRDKWHRVKGSTDLFTMRNRSSTKTPTIDLYQIASDFKSYKLIKSWSSPLLAPVWGALEKVPGGYVAKGESHPTYGFVYLTDDGVREGMVEQLTSTKVNLAFHKVAPHFIAGIGKTEPGSDATFIKIEKLFKPKCDDYFTDEHLQFLSKRSIKGLPN